MYSKLGALTRKSGRMSKETSPYLPYAPSG